MLRPYRGRLAAGALCPPIVAGLSLWVASGFAAAVDTLGRLPATDSESAAAGLARQCWWLLAAGVVIALLRFVARHLLIEVSRNLERDLKSATLAHLQRLPMAWFDRAGTGDLISRLTQDVELVRFMVGPAVLYGASAVVVVPGTLVMMSTLSPLLTTAIAVAFATLLWSSRRLLPKLEDASEKVQEAIGAVSDRALEDFMGVRLVLSFGRAAAENARLAALSQHYLDENVKLTRLRALYNLLIHVSTDCVTLAVLVVGGAQVLSGALSTGQMFEFLLLLGLVSWPLIALGWILATYPRAKAAMARIEEIFAQELEPGARAPAATGASLTLRGDLEVRNLTFTYSGRSSPALQDVSLRLPAGQKLGLVGQVGSGKSTLFALLLRLYDPPRGTVFVDGHDVLDLDAVALRRTFAVAPQDPFLFSDTIAENVRFGATEQLPQQALELAVHCAALEQDLPALPRGLDTVVGERGVTLSGGQKQRTSLARALAADRPALVLDDTLSAVDHATERRILERLPRHRAGRTMLVASHRLSAIADADLIVVLDGGRVVQSGTHAQLAGAPGIYRRFHLLQTETEAMEVDPS